MDIATSLNNLQNLEALGVTLPKTAASARAIHQAAQHAAFASSPSLQLRAAYEAGEITPENALERVQATALAHAAQQQALNVSKDLQSTLRNDINRALREGAPAIVATLAERWAEAAQPIQAAGQTFGPDVTAESAIALGPKAVKLYQQRDEHSQMLTRIATAYRGMVALLGVTAAISPQVAAFVEAPADLDAAEQVYRAHGWLGLAHAGYVLRLNTPDEAVAASKAYAAKRTAEEEEEKQARRGSMRFVGR